MLCPKWRRLHSLSTLVLTQIILHSLNSQSEPCLTCCNFGLRQVFYGPERIIFLAWPL